MDLIEELFFGNYTAGVCLEDTDEQRELLFKAVELTEEIERNLDDKEIIDKVKKINALNDKYAILKSADAFREGISFAFELISGLD